LLDFAGFDAKRRKKNRVILENERITIDLVM